MSARLFVQVADGGVGKWRSPGDKMGGMIKVPLIFPSSALYSPRASHRDLVSMCGSRFRADLKDGAKMVEGDQVSDIRGPPRDGVWL